MTSLPKRLRERLAFDSKRANRLAHEHRERTMLAREREDGKSLGDRIKSACFYAAKDEHARLRPYLEALIECVSALIESEASDVEWTKIHDQDADPKWNEKLAASMARIRECEALRREALVKISKLVGE